MAKRIVKPPKISQIDDEIRRVRENIDTYKNMLVFLSSCVGIDDFIEKTKTAVKNQKVYMKALKAYRADRVKEDKTKCP